MKVKGQKKTKKKAEIEKNIEKKTEEKSQKETKEIAKEKSQEEAKETREEKPQKETKETAKGKPQKEAKETTEEKPQKEAKGPAKEKPQKETKEAEKEKPQKETENITENEQENIKKGGKAKWIILTSAVILMLMISLAVGYVSVARSYSTRFLPASQINGVDCSDMNAAEVLEKLTPSVDDYVLEVKGRNFATGESGVLLGRITASDIDMHYEGISSFVENALAQQNEYKWLLAYFAENPTSYSVAMTMSYDEEKAKSFVQTWDAFQAENMRESQKAYISEYSEKTNAYQVIPKTVSTRINAEQACQYIIESLYNYETELDLEALGCYEELADPGEKKLNDTVNTANKWLSAAVTYDWNGSEVVLDKQQLREWISIVEDEPVLDADQVRSFVKKQAAANDTYGKTGSFTTVHDVTLKLYHASYGWKTDVDAETEELIKLIQEGSTVNREPAYSNEARNKGTSDIGDSYVEVDLTHQHLYLHNNGQIVLETDFVSGGMNAGNATPQGIFGITYKKLDAVLRGADYVTPVKYWMPFYGNYGMHDATWRRVFGGDIFINSGSHGCINLPLDKAAEIYQYVSKGFPVICYYYEVDPLAVQEAPPTASNSGEGQGNGEEQNPGEGQGNTAGQTSGEGQGNIAGQISGEGQDNTAGQTPSEGQSNTTGQTPGEGQGNTAGQNPSEVQDNNAGQNPSEGQSNTTGQTPGEDQDNTTGQPPGAGQNDTEGQATNAGENNNEEQNPE